MMFFILSLIFSFGLCYTYELLHVILVTRHGDRAPVFDPLGPYYWNCSCPVRISTSPLSDVYGEARLFNLRNRVPTLLPGTCQLGQLTELGMIEHLHLGQSLAKIYIPHFINSTEQVYIRSSYQDRTIQSAESLMQGLFPSEKFPSYNHPVIEVTSSGTDDMFINFYAPPLPCPILKLMAEAIQKSKAWIKLLNDTVEYRKEIAQKLDMPFSKISYFMLHDSLYCIKNHGFTLPGKLTNYDYWNIEKYATYQYNELYYGNEPFLRLGIGHFLGESILQPFQSIIKREENDDEFKMRFYSGHDTTIAPLALILGLNDENSKWPGFASNIRLELYKRVEDGQYVVRGLYNGTEMKMKGCNGEMYCQWSDFLENAQYWVPKDWKKECNS